MEGNTKTDFSPAKMRCSRCPRFVSEATLTESMSQYKRPLCSFCLSIEYYRRPYEEKRVVSGGAMLKDAMPMPLIVESQLSTYLSELWFQLYMAVAKGDWRTYEKVTEAMDMVLK